MKNKLWIIILLATFCLAAEAQGIERLFGEFASEDSESVKLGRFAMTLAGAFTDTYGVKNIEVISLEKAGEDVKKRFADAVRSVRDDGYEHLLDAKAEGRFTRIMTRVEADVINDLVILISGDNASMVRLKGKIKMSDIDRVINEHSK